MWEALKLSSHLAGKRVPGSLLFLNLFTSVGIVKWFALANHGAEVRIPHRTSSRGLSGIEYRSAQTGVSIGGVVAWSDEAVKAAIQG